MGVEIERKFLVIGDPVAGLPGGVEMVQAYVAKQAGNTVRVRVAGDRAWLTVKGPSTGARKVEVEVALPVAEARDLLPLCGGRVEKTRWRLPFGDHVWEIDVFSGRNAGLVVAEVELSHEDEPFARPPWLGEEVTEEGRYANAALADHPFEAWDR